MYSYYNIPNQNFSHIGHGIEIIGNLQVNGVLHLAGHVCGIIKVNDKSEISIAHSGYVIGDIHCHNIKIGGKVEGDIIATGTVVLESMAVVNGQINSKGLVMHPCASLNGKHQIMS